MAKIEDGGLMDQWNQQYPEQAVQPGDRFAEVKKKRRKTICCDIVMELLRSVQSS